ncbi:TetR/AcrR family transcriptional regulator [Undibacterium sp. TJN25]|uniref:TetR/AcrR family transcriptional regulator n=1 Tax=Undibacterium sp. TJN25 TaxID=3413056 RepID=UPI003BEF9231
MAKNTGSSPAAAANKPLKRPSQARARFTIQAIYDAFVRIWHAQGWAGVTTRALALETGIAVGTLYDYFPNKQAVLSGYVRHCMEQLLEVLQTQVIAPTDLDWQHRVQRLVALTCGARQAGAAYFDHDMLMLEGQIAETKHHRRVYQELLEKWQAALAACDDLPRRPTAETVQALLLAAWGGRRYLLLVQPEGMALENWSAEMARLFCQALVSEGDRQDNEDNGH